MNDYTVTIGGIEFNSKGPFYLQAPIRGFGRADVRTPSNLNSGADGGYIGSQLYGFRQIPLDVVLRATSLADFATYQQALNTALPIDQDLNVVLNTPSGSSYLVFARLANNMNPQIVSPGRCEYGIELLAADPLIYDNTTLNAVTIPKRVVGGLPWDSDGLYWDDGDSGGSRERQVHLHQNVAGANPAG